MIICAVFFKTIRTGGLLFAGCVLLGAPSSLLVRDKNDCAPGESVRTKDSFGHLFDKRAPLRLLIFSAFEQQHARARARTHARTHAHTHKVGDVRINIFAFSPALNSFRFYNPTNCSCRRSSITKCVHDSKDVSSSGRSLLLLK